MGGDPVLDPRPLEHSTLPPEARQACAVRNKGKSIPLPQCIGFQPLSWLSLLARCEWQIWLPSQTRMRPGRGQSPPGRQALRGITILSTQHPASQLFPLTHHHLQGGCQERSPLLCQVPALLGGSSPPQDCSRGPQEPRSHSPGIWGAKVSVALFSSCVTTTPCAPY